MCSSLDQSHPYVTNNLAYIYILLSKYEEAVKVCKQASLKNPKANNYFRNWAIALLKLKKPHKAVEVIKKAIELNAGDESNCTCNT